MLSGRPVWSAPQFVFSDTALHLTGIKAHLNSGAEQTKQTLTQLKAWLLVRSRTKSGPVQRQGKQAGFLLDQGVEIRAKEEVTEPQQHCKWRKKKQITYILAKMNHKGLEMPH